MYFSIVPPWSRSEERATSKKGSSFPRSSSGSAPADIAVEPTRSTKTIVASFRSAPSPAPSGVPQFEQKRSESAASVPQFVHTRAMGAR